MSVVLRIFCQVCGSVLSNVPVFMSLNVYDIRMCCVFTDNSDLNLRVDEAGVKGTPITAEGFAFMWAGVRGSYGVSKGKVCYEVKVCVTTVIISLVFVSPLEDDSEGVLIPVPRICFYVAHMVWCV